MYGRRQLRGGGGDETVKVFVKVGGVRRAGKRDHVNIKMPNGQSVTIALLQRKADTGWVYRLYPVVSVRVKQSTEAMNNAREAIELHIQGLKDDGQEVPKEEGS